MNREQLLSAQPLKLFARYVSLNVASMLGLSLYILADTYFIANGVGSEGLTALNLVLPIYSAINGLGLMLGMGGATLYSLLLGGGDLEKGGRVFTRTAMATAVFAVFLVGAGVPSAYPLAELLGGTGQVLDYAGQYLQVIFAFSPAFLTNNLLVCFVRNDGNPNLSMAAMLIGSLSNIVLDYVLVFPLGMGMFGAALATGLAPVLGITVCSFHFLRGHSRFKFTRGGLQAGEVKKVFSLGLPSLVNELSSGLVILAFNFVILSITGNTGVAAYGIVANLALIAIAVFTGVAQGMQPLLSVYHGAGKKRRIRSVLRYGILTALILGGLFYLIGFLFPDPIIAAFNRDGGPILAATAKEGILLYFISFLPAGINLVFVSFFSSVARPAPSFFLSISRGFLFVLPFLFTLPAFWGLTGVWWCVPLAETLTFAAGLVLLLRYRKKERDSAV